LVQGFDVLGGARLPVCECSSAALRFLDTRRVHRTSSFHRPTVCSKSQYLRGMKGNKRTPKARDSPLKDHRPLDTANDGVQGGAHYSPPPFLIGELCQRSFFSVESRCCQQLSQARKHHRREKNALLRHQQTPTVNDYDD